MGLVNRMKSTLNETTSYFTHHRNDSILSEGALSETTLKYEIPIYCKRVLVNKIKGTQNKTTLILHYTGIIALCQKVPLVKLH